MDGTVLINQDENGHEQVNEEQMDVSDNIFGPTENCQVVEVNKSKDKSEESFQEKFYSPFLMQGSTNKHPVKDNSVMSRIGPFADNRPICECDMVKQMTANPDVRYLLSLLPDMAEMNAEQKSVFKTRVLTLLHKTLMVES